MEYAYFKIFGEDCSISQQGSCMYRQVLTPPEPAMFSFRTKEKAISEKVLEAPDILTDFDLHLLDWSSTPLLAVALNKQLHLWDSQDEKAMHLLELSDEGYICSVKWATTDPILAVGLNSGSIELWDVVAQKQLRVMSGHEGRVPVLSWSNYIVSSGCRSGEIYHHDVRAHSHRVGMLRGHKREVCGLAWSPSGYYIASGGEDGKVNVWQASMSRCPVQTFTNHAAAVKALGWCPWRGSLLASGGGLNDHYLRLWNISSGVCVSNVDTKSQVSGLLWSEEYRELISSHGYPNNELTLWKYPDLRKVADLTGHMDKILEITLSSDRTIVASAGADETIKLWKCFGSKTKSRKKLPYGKVKTDLTLSHAIRKGQY
ncbi:cell division cycle protein 20 homolog isoform X2 [Tachypleus tridentatus]|uniref:cell division cycle protein 20 homolog isoform X2 n=1 Tax=Tachypleus tridentatus TaxID=6853 RepID=UPI003FCF6278